jgi:hypothetical protein
LAAPPAALAAPPAATEVPALPPPAPVVAPAPLTPSGAPPLAGGAAIHASAGASIGASAGASIGASAGTSAGISASPEPERPWTLLGLGFVPGLSTDFTRVGQVRHFLSLDVVAGVSGGSTGVTVSGVADVERGRVSGVQIAGVASLAWRVAGFQVAGVAAASGELDGVQIAGVTAIAGTAKGAQVGGVAAVSRGRADLQIAGVATVAQGRASTQVAGVAAVADGAARFQIAGVAAAARGDTNVQVAGVASVAHGANIQVAGVASVARDANIQVAGVTSAARGTANIQIAGVVNVARRLEGLQIAPINVARRVDGVQIGVINVGSADGFSFGLINIVPGGRADLEATVDSSRLGTLLFRHGGRRWHNVYGVGGHPVDKDGVGSTGDGDRDDVWMYGLGFGPSWRTGSALFDLELIGWQINHGKSHYDGLSLLGQLRLSMAYGLGPFQVVAGGALNTHVSSDPQSPLMLERRTVEPQMTREVTVVWWPSAFVGLRI